MKMRRRPPEVRGPERERSRKEGELPTIAVITMVRDEAVMLPRWVRHYSAQCGMSSLVVIDDNSTDGSTDDLPCTVIRVPSMDERVFEPSRMGLISGIASGLLNAFDAVLFADADEFVVADPAKYPDLRHFLADRPEPDVLGVMGLNVIHDLEKEGPLDPDQPVLAQRRLAKFVPLMCKPALKRVPAAWGQASHGIFAPYAVDPDLYMFHMKFADRDLLRASAEHRRELVERDGRAQTTNWRWGGDEMTGLLERVNETLDRDAIRPFRPPLRKLQKVVGTSERRGLHRATGKGQYAAMESHKVVRIPKRFHDAC